MNKILILLLLFSASFTKAFSQKADDILGYWMNPEKNAKIQVYKNGNKYMGKIVWMKEPYEADGKTLKKDAKGKMPILNIVFISNFVFDGEEWVDGTIYDPSSGKNYSGKMSLEGNKLELRGYLGSPMLGKSVYWTKTTK